MFEDLDTLTTQEHIDSRFYGRSVWASRRWVSLTTFVLFDQVSAVVLLIGRGSRLPWAVFGAVILISVALLVQWGRVWMEHGRVRASGERSSDIVQHADSALRSIFRFAVIVMATFQVILLWVPLR